MITLAHHPTVQTTIDRWHLELPIVPQLDESAITKEHLRLLVQRLILALEKEANKSAIDNSQFEIQ